jgi:hypothetical protein
MKRCDLSRARDEELLLWLSLRVEGLSWSQIAERVDYRGRRTDIATTVVRVQKADIEAAGYWGDDAAGVTDHYRGQK